MTESTTGRLTIIFVGREFRFLDGANEIQTGTFAFDLSKSPRTIDCFIASDTVTDRDVKGKTLLFVYEIKDGYLKMAIASDNSPNRPNDLEGKIGSLYGFRKIK